MLYSDIEYVCRYLGAMDTEVETVVAPVTFGSTVHMSYWKNDTMLGSVKLYRLIKSNKTRMYVSLEYPDYQSVGRGDL